MSFLDYNLDDVQEAEPLTEGEYTLNVVSVEQKVSTKSGNPYLNVRLRFEEYPESDDIYHIITLPGREDDKRTVTDKLRRLKRFMQAIEAPATSPIDFAQWEGLRCSAIVGIEENEEYGARNRVTKFVTSA